MVINMNKKLVLMGAGLLLTAATASAQKLVTGHVTDAQGQPVMGATVRVPGTKLVLPMSFMNASQPCRAAGGGPPRGMDERSVLQLHCLPAMSATASGRQPLSRHPIAARACSVSWGGQCRAKPASSMQ